MAFFDTTDKLLFCTLHFAEDIMAIFRHTPF